MHMLSYYTLLRFKFVFCSNVLRNNAQQTYPRAGDRIKILIKTKKMQNTKYVFQTKTEFSYKRKKVSHSKQPLKSKYESNFSISRSQNEQKDFSLTLGVNQEQKYKTAYDSGEKNKWRKKNMYFKQMQGIRNSIQKIQLLTRVKMKNCI